MQEYELTICERCMSCPKKHKDLVMTEKDVVEHIQSKGEMPRIDKLFIEGGPHTCAIIIDNDPALPGRLIRWKCEDRDCLLVNHWGAFCDYLMRLVADQDKAMAMAKMKAKMTKRPIQ